MHRRKLCADIGREIFAILGQSADMNILLSSKCPQHHAGLEMAADFGHSVSLVTLKCAVFKKTVEMNIVNLDMKMFIF